jgi:lipopolysaccharide export system permease protein
MGSIGRYVFRTTFGAFAVVLVSVTTLMWVTQALRNIDIITNQGQALFVFIGITALIIPLLVLLVAPIALMVAIAHVLSKLGNDSELIVMNAAGMSPWKIFQPFLAVSLCVSLLVAVFSTYLTPKCLRLMRQWSVQVRTDIVTNSLQPGRFLVLDGEMTLHIRDRRPNGQLVGIMIDDQRDRKERRTILAEYGDILVNERGTYLVLQKGTLQLQEAGDRDPTIVRFEQHAFDLSQLSSAQAGLMRFSVQERYPWELVSPPAGDTLFREQPGVFRAELHNRIVAPLYPLAFLVVTFAYLGAPRTTRQSRALSMAIAIAAVVGLRAIGFLGLLAGAKSGVALAVPYVALAATVVLGYWGISRGLIIEPPAFVAKAISAVIEGFQRRAAGFTGAAQ